MHGWCVLDFILAILSLVFRSCLGQGTPLLFFLSIPFCPSNPLFSSVMASFLFSQKKKKEKNDALQVVILNNFTAPRNPTFALNFLAWTAFWVSFHSFLIHFLIGKSFNFILIFLFPFVSSSIFSASSLQWFQEKEKDQIRKTSCNRFCLHCPFPFHIFVFSISVFFHLKIYLLWIWIKFNLILKLHRLVYFLLSIKLLNLGRLLKY